MVFKQSEHRCRSSLNSKKIIEDVRNSQNSESWSCACSCQADQSPTLILTRTSSGVRLQDQYSEMVQSGWTRSSCLPESIYQARRRWRDTWDLTNTTASDYMIAETNYFVFNSVLYWEPSQLLEKGFGTLCSTMQSY